MAEKFIESGPGKSTKHIKRDAVRVEVSFLAEFVTVNEDTIAETIEEVKGHCTSDRLGIPPPGEGMPSDLKELQDFQNISSSLMKMWQSIDNKLDALMKIVGNESHKLEGADSAIVKNISCKGLKLKSDTILGEGKFLLIRVSPPTFPSFTVDVVAKIIESGTDDNDGNWAHVEFRALNVDDEEILITYIFKRQREILRGQKKDS